MVRVLLLLLLLPFAAKAQWYDSIQQITFTGLQADTSVYSLDINKLITPPLYYANGFGNQGLWGSPQFNLVHRNRAERLGFRPGMQLFQFDASNNNEFLFQSKPYSDVTYYNGANTEQGIRGRYSQMITPFWNISVDYDRVSSMGFFAEQEVQQPLFTVKSFWKKPTSRYQFRCSFLYHKVELTENGGFADSLINANNSDFTRSRLQGAFRKNQTYLGKFINQYNVADSGLLKIGVRQRFRWQYSSSGYGDEGITNGDYPFAIDTNTVLINDTSYFNSIQSHHGAFFAVGGFDAFIFHGTEFGYYRMNGAQVNLANQFVGADFRYAKKRLKVSANGGYTIEGFNREDLQYEATASLDYLLSDSTNESILGGRIIAAGWDKRTPHLFENLNGTAYQIFQEQPRQNFQSVTAALFSKKYKSELSIKAVQTTNQVLFTSTSLTPRRFGETYQLLQLQAKKLFRWRSLGFEPWVVYQLQDRLAPWRLPNYFATAKLYTEGPLFKNALIARIQLQATYTSEYAGWEWSPYVYDFTYSNTLVGGLPEFNLMFAMRIKSVRVFVSGYNLAQIDLGEAVYSPNQYLFMKSYPTHRFGYRFGLTWAFFN